MNIEEFRQYCLSKKGVNESFPFDEQTLVFKVMGKIFALTSLETVEFRVNLKCDPETAIDLREQYSQVIPGYHMNKKHWNTVVVDSGLDIIKLKLWIDHSYDIVVSKLPKKIKEELNSL
ncbi:MAG: MmcQ/YjbR family DNA-binding protein [Bacteroidales bacterium]|nr:MmcQ/YjbR family DNA-binding protein [Bacteroidales bacterium]